MTRGAIGTRAAALLALALAGPALPAAAAQTSDVAVAQPSAQAMALAALMVTVEDVAGPAAAAQVRTMLGGVMSANPEMAGIERESPGLLARMIEAGMPIMLDSARRRLPELHRRLARLYDERLTASQIAEAGAFFASPLGRRYAAMIGKDTDVSRSTASMARSAEFTPATAAVVADAERSAASALARMAAADRAAIERIGATPALVALNGLTRDSAEIQLAWGEEFLPGEEARLDKAMTAAVEAHLAGAGG